MTRLLRTLLVDAVTLVAAGILAVAAALGWANHLLSRRWDVPAPALRDTGIGRWSRAEFVRAVRDGIRPDGSVVRPPMPRFRELDDLELAAVHAFLSGVEPARNPIPRTAPRRGVGGEALFAAHGCDGCHGDGAPFRGRLRAAASLPVEEIAARILAPERFSPGTQMPSHAGALGEEEARALAEYVRRLAASLPTGE